MNNKQEKYRKISLITIACYCAASLVYAFGYYVGIGELFIFLASPLIWLISVLFIIFRKKSFLAYSLIIRSIAFLILLILIKSSSETSMSATDFLTESLNAVSYITAGFVILKSRDNKQLATKLLFLPAILYLAYTILINRTIFSSSLEIPRVASLISDLILVAVFILIGLWAVNYDEIKQVNPVGMPIQNNKSDADRLLKLKELYDSGAITQQEFEEKKKQILNL